MIPTILIATFAVATDAAAAAPTVPDAFRGEWRHEVSACGSTGDDSILMIHADRLEFWESSGPVLTVTVHSPREVTLGLLMSGEGETWREDMRFRLSSDGEGLADITEGEAEPFIRRRCPAR